MTAVATMDDKNADPAPIGAPDINRIRWHCRRGMLELDMVLANFLEEHVDQLTARQLQEFERLVGLEDQALWRRITAECATESGVEQLLRACVVS